MQTTVFFTNPANAQFHEQFIPLPGFGRSMLFPHSKTVLRLLIRLARNSATAIASGIDKTGEEALDDLKKNFNSCDSGGHSVAWHWPAFASRAPGPPMSGIIQQVNTIFPANKARRVEHPESL